MSNRNGIWSAECGEARVRRGDHVRGRRKALVLAALMVLMMGGISGSIAASSLLPGGMALVHDSLTTVYANYTGNYTLTGVAVVNNVTFLKATTYRILTGNMSGAELADEWGSVQVNGSASIAGEGLFVGSILGSAPGHLTLSWVHVTGIFGVSVHGIIHATDGDRGLAQVSGWGNATVNFGPGASFSGSYTLHLDLA